MTAPDDRNHLVEIDTSQPIWDRFFTVAPLVLIGTIEPDGSLDLAPKHMAMPMGSMRVPTQLPDGSWLPQGHPDAAMGGMGGHTGASGGDPVSSPGHSGGTP